MNQIHAPRPAMAMSHFKLGIIVCLFVLLAMPAFAAQMNLAWNPSTSAGVAGYNVYYGETSGSYSSKLSVANQTTSTVTGLVEGKTYYFVVTARDAAGKESARSNEVSYTVPSSTATPLASFTASPPSGAAPLTVTFTGGGTGTIASYSWNFGDGTTSTQQNLTHSYATPGSYTVALTVTGPGGSNTVRQTINVTSATTTTPAPATTMSCPCSLWAATARPQTASVSENKPVNLGVKFRASTNGSITGIRFYKGPNNTGTHVGTLWTAGGQKLAEATFSGETATGWQTVKFAKPVPVTANTVYIASYFTQAGGYSVDRYYFANTAVTTGPLQALRDGTSGANGIYAYSSGIAFPTSGWQSSNYWVDAIFETTATAGAATPTTTSSLWSSTTAVPQTASVSENTPVNLGVKFRASTDGYITGIRFYKGPANTGTHVGTLWTAGGQKLAEATFSGETASGWQTVRFATPVPITANTVYVASYYTGSGGYSVDRYYFANRDVSSGPLLALRDGASGGNGVYVYNAGVAFPSSTWQSSNYWVDVVFAPR